MTRLTEAHLDTLTDEDLRALALRIVNDAVSALNTSIEEHDLTNHPDLDPAPVHEATNWLRKLLTHPDDGYNLDTWERYREAVYAFRDAAWDVGEATAGIGDEFPPWLNAAAVDWLLDSVYEDGGTAHRPAAYWLHDALDRCGGWFISSPETSVGYVLNVLCDTDDPRLPALAETYMQSGLHVNLRPAIDEATQQLARLDELADLNR